MFVVAHVHCVIQKMEYSGLLERKPAPEDARKRRVVLTAKGQTLREHMMLKGIELSKEHGPEISREDMLTTISVLIKVKEAFDIYNAD